MTIFNDTKISPCSGTSERLVPVVGSTIPNDFFGHGAFFHSGPKKYFISVKFSDHIDMYDTYGKKLDYIYIHNTPGRVIPDAYYLKLNDS
jgi:hypothetical protein